LALSLLIAFIILVGLFFLFAFVLLTNFPKIVSATSALLGTIPVLLPLLKHYGEREARQVELMLKREELISKKIENSLKQEELNFKEAENRYIERERVFSNTSNEHSLKAWEHYEKLSRFLLPAFEQLNSESIIKRLEALHKLDLASDLFSTYSHSDSVWYILESFLQEHGNGVDAEYAREIKKRVDETHDFRIRLNSIETEQAQTPAS